jgi:hypothetical protein
MSRLVVTVGIPRDGEAVVLRGPDRDYQAHRDYIAELRRTLPAGRDEIVVLAAGVSNGIAKRIKCDLSALGGDGKEVEAKPEAPGEAARATTEAPATGGRRKPLPKG